MAEVLREEPDSCLPAGGGAVTRKGRPQHWAALARVSGLSRPVSTGCDTLGSPGISTDIDYKQNETEILKPATQNPRKDTLGNAERPSYAAGPKAKDFNSQHSIQCNPRPRGRCMPGTVVSHCPHLKKCSGEFQTLTCFSFPISAAKEEADSEKSRWNYSQCDPTSRPGKSEEPLP